MVDEHVKERTELRMRGWRAWVKEQISAGGRGLHCFVKRKLEEPEVAMEIGGNLTASPQDVADADLGAWEKIWRKHEARAKAPWRGAEVGHTAGTGQAPSAA